MAEDAGFLGLEIGASHRVPGQKRKRLNRNKKKTWKRHIDARDVEEFIQDVQLQERTHGGLVAEKSDDTLYFMDTGNEEKEVKVTRGKGARKPLKIDLLLKCISKITPPKDILSHQIPNSKKLKRKRLLREKLERRGIISRRERLLQARLLKLPRQSKTPARSQPDRGFYDIWAEGNPLDQAVADKDSWYLDQTKKGRVKRPDHLNTKPSELPAVEVISSGGSYNPTFESHQALLLKAHEVELKREKEEEKLKRQLSFPTVDKAPTSESVFRELCQGLLEDSDEEVECTANQKAIREEEEEEDLNSGAPVSKSAIGEKKTERQRKREKQEKALVARRQAEKALRIKKQEVFKLRSIHTEIKQREHILAKRKNKRIAKRKAEATLPRRLGSSNIQTQTLRSSSAKNCLAHSGRLRYFNA